MKYVKWIGFGLLVVAIPALRAQDWASVSLGAWGGLAFSGGLSIALAYILWYYGVRHLGSSRTAVYSNTVPIVALIVAWLTLGEVPSWVQAVGTASILGGIGLSRVRRRPATIPEERIPPE